MAAETDRRRNDQDSSGRPLAYEAPTVRKLGSLSKLTLGSGGIVPESPSGKTPQSG